MLPLRTHRDRKSVSKLKQVAAIAPVVEALEGRAMLDATYHSLAGGNLSQNWNNTGNALTADNWAGVPSIVGYLGDGMTPTATSTDPQVVTSNGTNIDLVNGSSSGSTAGGVHEMTNDVVALQGSGSAIAPYLLLHLNSAGRQNINISYVLRELDATTADQKFALQYRTSPTGTWVNVPAGAVSGFAPAGNQSFNVNVTLPAAVNNLPQFQVRIMTHDAAGSDAMVGIDDIVVSSQSMGPAAPTIGTAVADTSSQITVTWTDNSSDETGFLVDRSTTSNFAAGTVTTLNAAANATSFTDTGLSAETQYWYRVRATNAFGDSANSGTATATTPVASASVVSIVPLVTPIVGEGDLVTFTISRTNFGAADAVSGTYSINGLNTGADGDDVDSLTGTWSFAAGAETTTFQVQISQDSTQEGSEQFEVTIALDGAPAGHVMGSDSTNFGVGSSDLPAAVVSISPAVSQTLKEGAGLTYTINRTNAAFQDAIVINYTITGTNSGADGSDLSTSSGTVTLAAGAASTSFSVTTIRDEVSESAENFGVSIALNGSPANHSLGDAAGGFSVAANLSMQAQDMATVQPTGPRTGAAGKQFFNIEGTGNGAAFWSYGVADYFGYNGPASTVGSITGISIATIDSPASFSVNGPVNVYVVTDTLTSIDNAGASPLIFDSADPEGLNGQLGSAYLLGTVNYDKNTQPEGTFTSFDLTTLNANGLALLVNALNNWSDIRIVVTPGNASVAATWAGLNLGTVDGVENVVMAPKLTFHYAEPSLFPTWVTADPSAATWDAGTGTLNVTGAATITANPDTQAIINVTGAGASLTINPTSDLTVRLAGLHLSGGATATVTSLGGARTAANHRLLVVNGAEFSVDSISKLDLTDNDLIVKGAAGQGVTNYANTLGLVSSGLFTGANGFWDGPGINSSSAATDPNGTKALATLSNDDGFGGALFGEFFGETGLGADDVIIKYTYFGDANLDGVVNGDDYSLIDGGFAVGGLSGWLNGDFNYSGSIDGDDYSLIDGVFVTQLESL